MLMEMSFYNLINSIALLARLLRHYLPKTENNYYKTKRLTLKRKV